MYYTKHKSSQLRYLFHGASDIRRNYSQAYQDMFVLAALDGKRGGTYLEIGAFDPVLISNTYLLESKFDWRGISIDIDPECLTSFRDRRTNALILQDALTINYAEVLTSAGLTDRVDYLQIDIEPKSQSLKCLQMLPLKDTRFSVITFETDFYDQSEGSDVSVMVRAESRSLLESYGYILVGRGIANTGPNDVFEDWWVDPEAVSRPFMSAFEWAIRKDQDFADSGERFMLKGPHLISSEFYDGQGLGNQLWAYTTTRAVAHSRDCNFGILGMSRFKGADFLNIDPGHPVSGGKGPEGGPPTSLPSNIDHYYRELRENLLGTHVDISRPDPDLFGIPINSKIDGNFQSLEYLKGMEHLVPSWISVKSEVAIPLVPENQCVIHVRGGDFLHAKDVFVGQRYYSDAVEKMRLFHEDMKFVCVTDDLAAARKVIPSEIAIVGSAQSAASDRLKASHHQGGPIAEDFLRLMNARYLIIPNSSFSWWAAYLNQQKVRVIAPMYWAIHNVSEGHWSTSDIITDGFFYLNRHGEIFDADICRAQRNEFMANNLHQFVPVHREPIEWVEPLATRLNRLSRHLRVALLAKIGL